MCELKFPKPGKKKKRKKHGKCIILQDKGTCYLCALVHDDYRHKPTHRHHIFGGPDRQKSETYGLTVDLCLSHHLYGPEAVHTNAETDRELKQIGQRAYEEHYSHELFVKEFGKNYL